MGLKQSIKRFFYQLLTTEFFGRLSRKIAYTTLVQTRRVYDFSVRFHHDLPYVRQLSTKITQDRLEVVASYYTNLRELITSYPYRPKISVLIPMYKTPVEYLREALQSVAQQAYDNWEICIVDDCSQMPELSALIQDFSKRYPGQIKFATNATNVHISETSNVCLGLATGDYIALLDHDDRLYPNSLAEVVRYINLNSRPEILYSDERTVSGEGEKVNTIYFKPDWSPYMHLCMNYTTHLSVYDTKLIRAIGGFRKGFEGSQDHDLMLRAVENSTKPVVHIPLCLYQWRAHETSTARAMSAKPYAAIAGEKAVTEALARRGRPCKVQYEPHTHHYRLSFELPTPQPLVSIVIPSKNAFKYISDCLHSIYEKTTYQPFEVIISDNGTTDPEVLALYDAMAARHGEQFRVIRDPHPFNFARQVNKGVAASRGAFLLILNNDTEVITPTWIEEMLGLAQFPDVGPVSCKLLFSDRTIQHAGIVTSARGIADHVGITAPKDDVLYCNVMNTIHESSAVTAACMMIEKKKYEAVGGMDELYLPCGYGDLEFCFQLRDHGYSALFTPYAELFHHESPSRGVTIEYFERFFLMERRAKEILMDPYLNPNLHRGTLYGIDGIYTQTDLNNAEFTFFLDTPIDQWTPQARALNRHRNKGKALV